MTAKQTFLDDAPKLDPARDDRLGFAPFAERLAAALFDLRAPNGYVVGLEGAWGSGKSTVLNFTKAYIKTHNDALATANQPVVVLDYQPWLIAGHQDLISGFFKILSERIDPKKAVFKNRWKAGLTMAQKGADPVFKAAGALGAAIDPTIGVASGAIAGAASATAQEALRRWMAEPSLQAAYKNLQTALRADHRRFIVFIDDLDRLDHDEIRAIAQMVKSVGSLPNVTYVLAYDRRIVWPALDGSRTLGTNQPSYGEKIIQHEVSQPIPNKSALLRLLDEQTEFLIGPTVADGRWNELVQSGLHHWIRSARDVSRLSNAVAFTGPALEHEVDRQDIMIMEGLRLFENSVFEWIRNNSDFLMGTGRYRFDMDGGKAAVANRLRAALPEADLDRVVRVLSALFPTRAKEFSGRNLSVSSEAYGDVAARRGVATQAGYDAFFSLSLAGTVVSKQDVDTVIAALNDEDAIAETMAHYATRQDASGASLIGALMEELRFRFVGRKAATPTQAMLNALFGQGEMVLSIDRQHLGLDVQPEWQYSMLITALLEPLGPVAAGKATLQAFEIGRASPAAAANFYVDRGRELGVFPIDQPPSRILIDTEGFERLGPPLLAMIEASVSTKTLADAPYYWDIIRAWKHLADPEVARAWLRETVEYSARAFAKVASGFLAYSVGGRGESIFLRQRPAEEDFSLEELKVLCDRHIDDLTLSETNQRRIAALRAGLVRMIEDPSLKTIDAF